MVSNPSNFSNIIEIMSKKETCEDPDDTLSNLFSAMLPCSEIYSNYIDMGDYNAVIANRNESQN